MEAKPKKCRVCGTQFTPYRSTDRFCSPKCATDYQKGSAKSLKTRAFKQSVRQREPVRRVRMKLLAKQRDHYVCKLAGVIPHTCDNRREAHHILYLSEGGVDELWNLITLCAYAHHQIAHGDKSLQWQLLSIVSGRDWYDKIDRSELSGAVSKKLEYLSKITGENSSSTDNIVIL